MPSKNLLVLDNESYRGREEEFFGYMKARLQGENFICYTSYEDGLIRKVRNYKRIGSLLQHILYWKKSYDYAMKIFRRKYDRIYCLNPIVGIFLGLLNKKSRIVLCGFLFEPKKNRLYYKIRKFITKKALKGISKVIVYSSSEVTYYKKEFPETYFVFVKYGVDFFEYKRYEKRLPEKYIFSGGGSNRNYDFLIKAYNKYFDSNPENSLLPLVIATQGWRLNGIDTSKCVILEDVVLENFWEVLAKSEFLVLSLKDTEISAGHMVMFQAMKMKIPIIINDIPAVRDYVDERSVIFYNSKDENGLISALLLKDKCQYVNEAYKEYSSKLTFSSFLLRILDK